MKRFGFILLFTILSLGSFAQYYPMVEENKVWSVASNFRDINTRFYKLEGDTVIEDITYKKLIVSYDSLQQVWSYQGAMRENENHQVFYREYLWDEESLIYDFTPLPVGQDTLYYINSCDIYLAVDAIDSVQLLNGEFRKRYHFYNDQWIEGIGSTMGPLGVYTANCTADIYEQLNCYTRNDTLLYQSPGFASGNCYIHITSVRKLDKVDNITLLPNPVQSTAVLHSPVQLDGCNLTVHTLTGNLLRTFDGLHNNEFVFDRSGLRAGIYLLKLSKGNELIGIGKVMVID